MVHIVHNRRPQLKDRPTEGTQVWVEAHGGKIKRNDEIMQVFEVILHPRQYRPSCKLTKSQMNKPDLK